MPQELAEGVANSSSQVYHVSVPLRLQENKANFQIDGCALLQGSAAEVVLHHQHHSGTLCADVILLWSDLLPLPFRLKRGNLHVEARTDRLCV